MFKPVHCIAVLLALSACWVPASAQDVYRCGHSYSNLPCPGGIVVATADPRSATQRAQTEAATRRDTKLAQLLQKDRLKLEADAAPAIILAPMKAAEPTVPLEDKRVFRKKQKNSVQFFWYLK